jgi:hypothetical protein
MPESQKVDEGQFWYCKECAQKRKWGTGLPDNPLDASGIPRMVLLKCASCRRVTQHYFHHVEGFPMYSQENRPPSVKYIPN